MKDGFSRPIALNCPSCGSPMGAPDVQGLVQCGYCGTKVVLPPPSTDKESRSLGRFVELSKVARQAGNWKELREYASSILEIDPTSTEAWLDKALATGSFMAGYTNGFDEAFGYIRKAEELSPGDPRITETQTMVSDAQYKGYVNRALQSNKLAVDAFNLGVVNSMTISPLGEAMAYFREALRVKPNDPYALQAIVTVNETAKSKGIRWNDPKVDEAVRQAERSLSELAETQKRIQDTEKSAKRLEALRHTLLMRKGELERAKQKSGFFAKLNIEDLQDEIRRLSTEIQRLQRQA